MGCKDTFLLPKQKQRKGLSGPACLWKLVSWSSLQHGFHTDKSGFLPGLAFAWALSCLMLWHLESELMASHTEISRISRDGDSWWHLYPLEQKVRDQRHYSTGTFCHGFDPLIWQERLAMHGEQNAAFTKHRLLTKLPSARRGSRKAPSLYLDALLGQPSAAPRSHLVRVWSPLTTCCLRISGFDGPRITSKVLISKMASKGSCGNQRINKTYDFDI